MDQIELAERIKRSGDLVKYQPQLEYAERNIMESLRQMASSLKDIEEKELWRYAKGVEYSSLEDYCQRKWGIGLRRRQQLKHAEQIRLFLADNVESPEAIAFVDSMKEGHVRALEQVVPEKRVEVIEVASRANERPTKTTILEIAEKVGGIPASKIRQPKPPTPPKQLNCPHCGKNL